MTFFGIIVVIVEVVSMVMLGMGLLSYRAIITSHRAFHLSLGDPTMRIRKKSMGLFAWLYMFLTVLLVALTSIVFFYQPQLFLV